VLVLAAFCAAAVLIVRAPGRSRVRLLAPSAATTLVLALASLGVTAYWFHHLQALAYPAALIAATMVSGAAISLGPRAGAVAAAACVLFALWSSIKNEDRLGMSTGWTSSGGSTSSEALEQARKRFFGDDEHVTYMAFGGNSENAHAVFISDQFDLVCRWFHLYPHSTEEQLEETKECSRREDPELILVTLGFFDTRAGDSWQDFVSSARQLLDTEYELVVTTHPGFQVWKRKSS
jgi:hypothetical protein